jgi:hypothetical protein
MTLSQHAIRALDACLRSYAKYHFPFRILGRNGGMAQTKIRNLAPRQASPARDAPRAIHVPAEAPASGRGAPDGNVEGAAPVDAVKAVITSLVQIDGAGGALGRREVARALAS